MLFIIRRNRPRRCECRRLLLLNVFTVMSILCVPLPLYANAGEKILKSNDGAEHHYLVALAYLARLQSKDSRSKARENLEKSAQKGDPRAMNMLGFLQDPFWFPDKNTPKEEQALMAASWYLQAAAKGFSPAEHNLRVLREKKWLSSDFGASLAVERASLANQRSTEELQGASSRGTAGAQDAKSIFAHSAPAVAEILGDGNYGSGVAVARVQSVDEGYLLKTSSGTKSVPYRFFSRSRREPVKLIGNFMAVLTNRHVLQGSVQIQVGLGTNENGETLRAFSVQGVCLAEGPVDLDLAMVFLAEDADTTGFLKALAPVPLYDSPLAPAKGSVVFALGNPERLPRTITQGLFNGERTEGLQFDAPISKGSSGGALLDANGQLLGLIVGFASAEGSQNLNFAIPYAKTWDFLEGKGMRCYVP
jgi:S1-C subfamily serine protease